jgi:hypothetical protein
LTQVWNLRQVLILGGTLEVVSTDGTSPDNREGVGSEFVLTLPFEKL